MKNLGKKEKHKAQSNQMIERNERDQNNQESPYYDTVPNNNDDIRNFQPRIIQNEQQIPSGNPNQQIKNNNTQIEPTMLEYKLEKLLLESQKRQQAYQQYIKKKHQQSYEMTENYIKALKFYKQQLDLSILQLNKKKQTKFLKYQANKVLSNKSKPANKYKKVKLSPYRNSGLQNQRTDLECKITLKFILPVIEDYLKQKFPENLDFLFELPIKTKHLHPENKKSQRLQVSIKMQDDENENLDNLINGYPFNMVASGRRNGIEFGAMQGDSLSCKFKILNQVENIADLQKGKIWIKAYDRDSKMLCAYSSLPTEQLLYYSQQSSMNNPIESVDTEVMEFFSPYSHKNNFLLHVRQFLSYFLGIFLVKLCRIQIMPLYNQKTANRVESTGPLELALTNVDKNISGDQQSRQLQRINKFKTSATSLIMRPDYQLYNKAADKDKNFANNLDKNIVNYHKAKQIQTINKYKQQQKNQYVENLFDQAFSKYSLEQVQMGVQKYLLFYYEKQKSQPEKIFIKSMIKCGAMTKQLNEQEVLKQVELKLMSQQQIEYLLEKGSLNIKGGVSIDMQGSQREGFFIFDNKVAFVLRVIIYPNRKLMNFIEMNEDNYSKESEEIQKQKQNQRLCKLRFQVLMRMSSEVGEILSQQMYKVQPIGTACNYEMSFHNYELQEEDIKIPLNLGKEIFGQASEVNSQSIRVVGSENLVYKLSKQCDMLQLRIRYHKISDNNPQNNTKRLNENSNTRTIIITLLDSQSNFILGSYKITLHSYHKMQNIADYQIGQICNYKFQFSINQQTFIGQNTKGSRHKQQTLRVGLFSSHPNQTEFLCNGKQQQIIHPSIFVNELILDQNYEMSLTFQSFQTTLEERVILHLIDLTSYRIIKKYLLKIAKNSPQFKLVNQIKIQFDKNTKYPYFLRNKTSKQTSYKLFTSNHSVLTVPESPILLSPNQQTSVDFYVLVKRQNLTFQQKQNGIHVIVRVEDNINKNGWNQLFKIFVI